MNLSFPMLSDFSKREVAKTYGVLIPEVGVANRATFVVDKEGKIVHIEEGSGASASCRELFSSGCWLFLTSALLQVLRICDNRHYRNFRLDSEPQTR